MQCLAFSDVWDSLETEYVPIYNGKWKLRTISMNKESKATPLVLVHGMGAGVGFWVLNLQFFARVRPVYAFDLLGFGQSSRPEFPNEAMLAEMEFVESIEEWRKSMNLDKFILLGHSLGGFLAASYAIRYPDRVRHLVLADPWGFPEPPNEAEKRTPIPFWIKVIAKMIQPFNPFAILRAVGPLGKSCAQLFCVLIK
jgi:pimeloyl-ACP methyl ester carboxylesterase